MRESDLNENQANILIVDDTPENLRLLVKILSDQGYRVRPATSGSMALTATKANPPHLILLDVNMPVMNGYEVCQKLKEDEQTKDIPVIFLSALDETLDKVKAFAVGGLDYITKPFQAEELVARIETHLTLRRLQQQLEKQNLLLQEEQKKSEKLLLNILPKTIVEQLKYPEEYLAESYDNVTILFADIVNFTCLAEQMRPLQVMSLLNQIFSAFDRLTEQYNLEKIKTIGDAYMVVGGLPQRCANHAEAIAQMALEMQIALQDLHLGFIQDPILSSLFANREPLQIRIGINTGSVVAGVIGIKKFSYDLWGDAVNIASRMESSGLPGKIQLTQATYERIKDQYHCQERGTIMIKGKGTINTYWLTSKKS